MLRSGRRGIETTVDLGAVLLRAREGPRDESVPLQTFRRGENAVLHRVQRVAGAAQLLLRVLLLVGGHAEPEDLQQKRRAQKQRRERHGKKRRVQPLPEGMEMKPLHAPASVPR